MTGVNGFAVSIGYPKAADAKRVFDALAQGGKVTMPMDKTFWSSAFGMCVGKPDPAKGEPPTSEMNLAVK